MNLLFPHPLDSQAWLVLQKGSVTGREGASPDPSLVALQSWKSPCEKREISAQRCISFTFLQVSYQISSNCGAFTLRHRIIKFKYIQPTNFKTEFKINSLFFMPDKAVGRLLQRLIMVYKMFWL